MIKLNIDNSAVVVFTNKLEKISKQAMPNAVRVALNSAAFDVKQNTMPKTAEREFIMRAPTFFKANSKVEMASGSDIRLLKSTVGFIAKGGNKADKAVEDLEAQEYGGDISSRSFIPLDTARGGDHNKKVRPSNRIGGVNKVINANTIDGKTPAQQFQHAASQAGPGGYVIGNNEKQTLFRVKDVGPSLLKVQPLFSFKKGRKVNIDATGFMRDATMQSAEKLHEFFITAAQKQLDRI